MRKMRWLTLALSLFFVSPALAKKKPGHFKVSQDQAHNIALAKVQGTIVHSETEWENGRWIYSIEVRPTGETGKKVKEINVDANSGKVVDISTENE